MQGSAKSRQFTSVSRCWAASLPQTQGGTSSCWAAKATQVACTSSALQPEPMANLSSRNRMMSESTLSGGTHASMKSHKLHFAGGHWLVPITPAENQLKPWRWKKASLVTSPVSSLALTCTRSHTRWAQLSSGVDTLQTSSPHAPEVHSESFVSGCTSLSPTQTVNTDGCHPLFAANSCKTSPKLASKGHRGRRGKK